MSDRHQALMDQAYDRWQACPAEDRWSKQQFWDQLNADERFAVFTGNFNNQVCNGGFMQWLDNGYATDEVVGYLVRTLPRVGGTAQAVADLIVKFAESTAEYSPSMDEDEYREMYNCTDELSTQYYDINEQFMTECEEYINNTWPQQK